jgi:flagellar protein FliT
MSVPDQEHPMDAHRILSTYEHIAGLMDGMVEAARCREWERLRTLESSCKHLIDKLKRTDLDVPMSQRLRQRRTRLIGEVLRADAQIRDLTEPLAVQLRAFLGGGKDMKRAVHARPWRSRNKL